MKVIMNQIEFQKLNILNSESIKNFINIITDLYHI